ncbi:MAG: nucleotide-binding protein [Alphaproteobacteria bacterium]|nr:nucleotide-binding protein [Alphaproteobacteria bacterium]
MARRPPAQPPIVPKTEAELRSGLRRLKEVAERLDTFDIANAHPDDDGELSRLIADIAAAVDRAFPAGSSDHDRYSSASSIHGFHSIQMADPFGRGGYSGPNLPEYRRGLTSDITRSKSLLASAISTLEADISDMAPQEPEHPVLRQRNNRIFIVHGRADGPKNTVARFLTDLGLLPIILHEQPNQGRSTIEKIEAFDDVDFAVVLFTPDDFGALQGETPNARPRQNVLFELGYFIGRLKRSNVCVLRQGEVEILSDYVGPIWLDFDGAGAWKSSLVRELRAAKFELDPAKVIAALGL